MTTVNIIFFVEDQNDSDDKNSSEDEQDDDQLIQSTTADDIDKIFTKMNQVELQKLSNNTGRTIKALKISCTKYGVENILK